MSDSSDSSESEDDVMVVGKDFSEESLMNPNHPDDSDEKENPQKKKKVSRTSKKKKSAVSFEDNLLSYLHNRPKEEEDPDKHFLLSLLPQIKALTQNKKNQLYISILNSIQQISSSSDLNNTIPCTPASNSYNTQHTSYTQSPSLISQQSYASFNYSQNPFLQQQNPSTSSTSNPYYYQKNFPTSPTSPADLSNGSYHNQ